MSKLIFGKFWKEFAWLYLPGLFSIFFCLFWHGSESSSNLYYFLVLGVADLGHVCATFWRTYLNPREVRRSMMYWYVPILLALYFGLKRYFQVSLTGFILIDSSIRAIHNVRQFYGISKWYQKLNDSFRLGSDYFLYFFCFTPMLIGPLKSGKWNSGLLWLGTNDVLYTILLGCYGLVFILWICYELSSAGRRLEWNRILAIAYPACVYSLTYMFGTSIVWTTLLLFAHGAQYYGLNYLACQRLPEKNYQPLPAVLALLILPALVGGVFLFMEAHFELFPKFAAGPFIVLLQTLAFSHYIFDAFLWRRKHPDGKYIFLQLA